MNLSEVQIETQRLELRPISEDFAEAIFMQFTKEITTYMYPQPSEDINGIQAFVKSSIEGLVAGTNLQLVILDHTSHEFLGCCGLHNLDHPEPELGIWLKKSAHGNGYGLETIEGIINWAKANRTDTFIKYPVDRRNAPSRRIPETFKGKIINEFKVNNMIGEELDIVEYWINLQELD